MNIGIPDLDIVRRGDASWVVGLSRESGQLRKPQPYTATGCLHGMRAVLEEVFGNDDFNGPAHFLVQGIGAVGGRGWRST